MRFIKYRISKTISGFGVIRGDGIYNVKNASSVSALFDAARKNRITVGGRLPLSKIKFLPPTDEHPRLFCAGLNYLDHAREMRAPVPKTPVFFTKAGALNGPFGVITHPRMVSLLDYEIELAVIIGRKIGRDDIVTRENLADFMLGITIFNDVSARDVQIASGQWFLGKSFRGFAPIGPVVQTIDKDVAGRLYSLNLELQVYSPEGIPYSDKRQRGSTADMIFGIDRLVNCLREKFDLLPGDVIATGTPRGVALSKPGRLAVRIADILGISQARRNEMFIEQEIRKNRRYLARGDMIVARIFSDDGVVHLGGQRNRIA